MKDSFNRRIDYLRISVTDFCNFRCSYCMPEEGIVAKKREEILSLEEIYFLARLFVEMGVTKIRLTGGEPLLRPGLEGLIYSIARLEPIRDLAMTTNAYVLEDRAKKLKEAGLNRVNISLDSLNPMVFSGLTKGELAPVLRGIDAALEAGLGVKINTVLLKGINDGEIEKMADFAMERGVDIRFIELMPLGENGAFSDRHFLSCDAVLERLELEELERQVKSSPATMYSYKGKGRVGLIRPLSCSFCSHCNRLRLSSDGKLRPCLHSDEYIDLLTPLRKGEDLRPYIEEALKNKPFSHHINEGEIARESMHRIGG